MKRVGESAVNVQDTAHVYAPDPEETQAVVGALATSTITVHVDGFTCGLCIGDVMERVHMVPGVERVAVGPMDHGQAWVTVTSSTGPSVTVLERALSRGGFHISSGRGPLPRAGDYERRAPR